MTSELISAAEMAAIREVPLSGMQTPCSVLTQSSVDRPDGDPEQVWAETAQTVCWIYEPLDYPRGNAVGAMQGVTNEFRCYLPVGTDIGPGDRLGVNGEIFNVINTSSDNTYQPMLRLALLRVE